MLYFYFYFAQSIWNKTNIASGINKVSDADISSLQISVYVWILRKTQKTWWAYGVHLFTTEFIPEMQNPRLRRTYLGYKYKKQIPGKDVM